MPDHAVDEATRHRTGFRSLFDRVPASGDPSDPTRSIPGTSGHEPGSVAELVDSALMRIDRLRDRPVLSTMAMTLLGMVVAAAWWFGRPGPVMPIEDRIPMARTAQGTDDVVSEVGQDAGGAAGVEDTSEIDSAVADVAASVAGEQTGADGTSSHRPVGVGQPAVQPSNGVVPEPVDDVLVVHVSGEVVTQGLVELTSGARIADAIAAAGGPTPAADVHRLNLAAGVIDGTHIRVPAVGADPSEPLIETAPGLTAHDPARTHTIQGGRPVSPAPVDINRANAAELETLPGIGPSLAQAIIRWRTENGGFAAVDDLLLVPGIGPAKLAALIELVTT